MKALKNSDFIKVVNGNKYICFLYKFVVLCKYLDFAILFDNLELLIDGLRMCGEAYLDYDNITNAFFCFN